MTTKTNIAYTIETFCPVFPGFYNTIFEADESGETTYEDVEIGNILVNHNLVNYEQYHNEVAEEFANKIADCLQNDRHLNCQFPYGAFISALEFQELVSPKYYNYENDSINIKISLTVENIQNINKYLIDHLADFEEYLENQYPVSAPGFIPFHTNDYMDWFQCYINDSHKLGAVLDFVLKNSYENYSTSGDGLDLYIYYEMCTYSILSNAVTQYPHAAEIIDKQGVTGFNYEGEFYTEDEPGPLEILEKDENYYYFLTQKKRG